MKYQVLLDRVADKYKPRNGMVIPTMRKLIENQMAASQGLIQLDAESTGDILLPDVVAMPIIAQVFPQLFATKVCQITPMNTPAGLIYYKTYSRDKFATFLSADAASAAVSFFVDDASGISVGDAVSIVGVTGTRTVSGKVGKKITVSVALGADISYGAVVTGTDSAKVGERGKPRQARFKMTSKTVTAEKRILQAGLSSEVIEDMRRQLGIDAQQTLIDDISADILREIDRDIITALNGLAGIAGDVGWDSTYPGVDSGYSKAEYNATLVGAIIDADTLVMKKRFRSTDYIIANPTDAARLTKLSTFRMEPKPVPTASQSAIGVKELGTLNEQWTVFTSPDQTLGKIIVGIKNEGIAYCPYVLLAAAPSGMGFYDPETDTYVQNLRTRDAITSTTEDSFGTVTIS